MGKKRTGMPIGKSNRIVVEMDRDLKRALHSRLAREGRTLKEWLELSAREYLAGRTAQADLPFSGSTHQIPEV